MNAKHFSFTTLIVMSLVVSSAAQTLKLEGTTWRISYCVCYGGDNDWIDGGNITFYKQGKTSEPDQRWRLTGKTLKVSTNDKYGREFTGRYVRDRFTGTLFEGMNKRAMKFVAVRR